jgi:hypothetical protein
LELKLRQSPKSAQVKPPFFSSPQKLRPIFVKPTPKEFQNPCLQPSIPAYSPLGKPAKSLPNQNQYTMKYLKWILSLSLCVCTALLPAQSATDLFGDPFEGMELKKEWTEHPAFKEYKAAFDNFRQVMFSGTLDFAAFEEMGRKMAKENPSGPPSEQNMIEEMMKIKGGKEFLEASEQVRVKQKIVAEKLPDFFVYQKEFLQKKVKGNH